jgi:hypothetical protein
MLVSEVINRAFRIAGDDPDSPYRWSSDLLLEELNDIVLEVGQELGLFKQTFDVTIFDGQAEYDYDESITEIYQLRTEGYAGRVIFPTSVQQLTETGRIPTQSVLNGYGSGITMAFHNSSSYGKLKLDPIPRSEDAVENTHVWTA